ncbi:MAG: ribonuclease P protein subunit [Nanoarchaeota archaeon]|nr:ribonuclease P protein subunit [Nanoarchaeota archaeon]MBU1855128.1 ribonuclease P protein subunit [Nanoarchaeota archaeon]
MRELKQEYIGSDIEIIESTNKTLIGLKGKVIDETKNTISIKTKNNETKKLLKNVLKFKIGQKIIDGKTITKKPQDRIKIKN